MMTIVFKMMSRSEQSNLLEAQTQSVVSIHCKLFLFLGCLPKDAYFLKTERGTKLTIEVNNSWSTTLSIFILQLGGYTVDFSSLSMSVNRRIH